jgi:hypothetical protein
MQDDICKTTELEWCRIVAEALHDVDSKATCLPFEDVLKSYRELEISLLSKVTGDERLVLETKRLVLEGLLHWALEKKCPFDVCRDLFQEHRRLGFAAINTKTDIYLAYFAHCRESGNGDEGIRLLGELEVELQDAVERDGEPLVMGLLQDVQNTLRQLGLRPPMTEEQALTAAKLAWSADLGQSLAETMARARDMSFEEFLVECDGIEKKFVEQIRHDDFLVLEAKRRVAEAKVWVSIEKNLPHSQCRFFFEDLTRVGFTDLEQETSYTLRFARYCFRVGAGEEAIPLLRSLETKLKDGIGRALTQSKTPAVQYYKNQLRVVREQLEDGSN